MIKLEVNLLQVITHLCLDMPLAIRLKNYWRIYFVLRWIRDICIYIFLLLSFYLHQFRIFEVTSLYYPWDKFFILRYYGCRTSTLTVRIELYFARKLVPVLKHKMTSHFRFSHGAYLIAYIFRIGFRLPSLCSWSLLSFYLFFLSYFET